MSTQNGKRQELGLTQTEAARRAGVSLPTWRRWEADPSQVSEETNAKCRKVLDRDVPTFDVDWSTVEAWRDHPYLTPRQAAALVYELNGFGDLYLAEWLNHQHEPLHDTPPFDQLDRRVMFHVGDNQAWVAEARDHCYAVASGIEKGKLPHDQVACFFDEFVVFAASTIAEETYPDKLDLGLYDQIPTRERRESEDEADWMTGDEDWEDLAEWLVDSSAWDVQAVCGPRGQLSPLVQLALSEHHPFTWFDLPAGGQQVLPSGGR